MKPEQIQKAAAELLAEINASTKPANEIINAYTRARRYIGSKDRHQLTELVWAAIKSYPTPKWLLQHIPVAELEAMKQPAHTILRVNGNREQAQQQLANQGILSAPTPLSPLGLVLQKRTNLQILPEYKNGLIEVQDEGSQLVTLATHIDPNTTVLDYCAGAGGKSLCLAQIMQNQGKIIAHDISKHSLKELQKRAKRAHASIIQTSLKPQGFFQHVVVDAPCSGSGTWRRNPDGRLKLTEKQLAELTKKQANILDQACLFVQPNGFLHYMTCSLIQLENQNQARAFLKCHPDFKLIHHQQWTPAKTNTDGFFLATFQKVQK